MKRLFYLFSMAVLIILLIPQTSLASVEGDGYGFIGGEELVPASPPVEISPAPIPTPEPTPKPTPKKKNKEAAKPEPKEPEAKETQAAEETKIQAPEEKTVSDNSFKEKPPEEKKEIKQTEPVPAPKAPADVPDKEQPEEEERQESPNIGMILLKFLKVITSLLFSYVIVFAVISAVMLPRMYYLTDDMKYRFCGFLIMRSADDSYRVHIFAWQLRGSTGSYQIRFGKRFSEKHLGELITAELPDQTQLSLSVNRNVSFVYDYTNEND